MTMGMTVPRARPVRFAPFHKWDRNFFAILVGLIWVGIGMGFGTHIVQHLRSGEAAYPPIVHVHAAIFVGWLVLLTVQLVLIRTRRVALHRKLGVLGAGLAAVMLVLGPATGIYVHGLQFGTPKSDPAFLSIQFTDLIAFGGLVLAAILLRKDSAAHKRLILLATLYISDAGFSRWLGHDTTVLLGSGFWAFYASLYFANDVLILALGGYDLVTRKRLQPAYAVGVVWMFANQLTADILYHTPAWKTVALRLIGH